MGRVELFNREEIMKEIINKRELSNDLIEQFQERLAKTMSFYASKDGEFVEQLNQDIALCESGISFFSNKFPKCKNEQDQRDKFRDNMEDFSNALGDSWFHWQDPEEGCDFKLRDNVCEFLKLYQIDEQKER